MITLHEVHRQAGLAIQFEWQDLEMETGETRVLDSTQIIGKFTDKDAWLVCCEGAATDGAAQGEYWWPVKAWLVVYEEDGKLTSRHATKEEIESFGGEI